MTIPIKEGVYLINPNIDQSITGIFQESSRASGISGVKLTHENSTVEIPAAQFPQLSSQINIEEIPVANTPIKTNNLTVTRKNEMLYIRKPDLLSDAKWEFKFDKYITADIEDKAFLESVHSGKQSIVAKMFIIADLRVVMEYGKDGLPDESTCKYTIVKVHSVHTPQADGQIMLSE